MSKKFTTDEFINKSKSIHKDNYSYDKCVYTTQNDKVKLLCNRCNEEFEILPTRHIHRKVGCLNCSVTKKLTAEIFIKKANIIHDHKYNYSNIVYTNDATKVEIICYEHGSFYQSYMNHVRSGQGCPDCNGGVFVPLEIQKERLNSLHDNKYDYSLIDENSYSARMEKQSIICPEHGTFNMQLGNHLNGQGCPKCKSSKPSTTKENFLKKVNKLYNNNYNYDLKNFDNLKSIIQIKCDIHGWFDKIAGRHLHGKQGCPICKSSLGEIKIYNYLKDNHIDFIKEKRFDKCKDKSQLPFDFYLIKYNICVEFDGIQHFEPINYFGGEDGLKETIRRDLIKTEFCKDNDINLIRITYKEIDEIENILKELLWKKIH